MNDVAWGCDVPPLLPQYCILTEMAKKLETNDVALASEVPLPLLLPQLMPYRWISLHAAD